MKSLLNKLNNYRKNNSYFVKKKTSEILSKILIGVVITIVGGYILFLITKDGSRVKVPLNNEKEYFDTGMVPATHSVDTTDEYRKIRELSAGLPVSKFKEILGDHTFVNNLSDEVIEYVFVNPLYYVEAAVNIEKTVIFYSVTTRKRGFNPKFEFGSFSTDTDKPSVVELGKTTYAELDRMFNSNPIYASYTSGVNWFYYFESYYVGRTANYQSFIFSTNQSGFYRSGSSEDKKSQSDWPLLDPSHQIIDNSVPPFNIGISDKKWVEYRKNAIINTYTETVPFLGAEDIISNLIKEYFGPNLEQVRLVD